MRTLIILLIVFLASMTTTYSQYINKEGHLFYKVGGQIHKYANMESVFQQDPYALNKQSSTRPLNNINLNLLGDGALLAINYERLFVVKSNVMLSAKVGYGYYQEICFVFCKDLVEYRTIPLHLTANIGTGSHFLEVGLGGNITVGYSNHNIYPIIGYRLQPLRTCLLYTSPSPRDGLLSRMPSSA